MFPIPDINSILREDEARARALAGAIIAQLSAQIRSQPKRMEWEQSIQVDADIGLLAMEIVTHEFNTFRGSDGRYPYTASARMRVGDEQSEVVVYLALKDLR